MLPVTDFPENSINEILYTQLDDKSIITTEKGTALDVNIYAVMFC